MRFYAGIVVSCVLSVCVAHPRRGRAEERAPVLPSTFDHQNEGEPTEAPYWEQFADPVLAELIERGLAGNFDIETARQRVAQAEAIARQALAPLLPSVTAEGSWSLRPFDSVGLGVDVPVDPLLGPVTGASNNPERLQQVAALLKATYLVDITGRYYTARQAALRDAAASTADAESQAQGLVSLIALTYYDVVTAQIRVAVVEEQVSNNEGWVELMEARFKTGAANALNVLQQRQQLEATQAQLPLARALLTTARQQLAVLIGEPSVSALPEIGIELPVIGEEPPTGKPERLLHARPDLRAAMERQDAAAEREKSAFRTLLPSLALSGQVGYLLNHSDEWDHGDTWSLGVLLSLPIYEGGRNRGGLDQAKAAHRGATSTLYASALQAVQEVDTALVREREQRKHYEAVQRQTEAAKAAYEEARKRYLVGLSDYLNVLAAQGTYQSTQLSVLQAESNLVAARVNLLSVLGGDWTRTLVSGR